MARLTVAGLREEIIHLQLDLNELDDPELEQARDYLYKARLELEQVMAKRHSA